MSSFVIVRPHNSIIFSQFVGCFFEIASLGLRPAKGSGWDGNLVIEKNVDI